MIAKDLGHNQERERHSVVLPGQPSFPRWGAALRTRETDRSFADEGGATRLVVFLSLGQKAAYLWIKTMWLPLCWSISGLSENNAHPGARVWLKPSMWLVICSFIVCWESERNCTCVRPYPLIAYMHTCGKRRAYLPEDRLLESVTFLTQVGTLWCSCSCLHSSDTIWIGTKHSF